MRLSCNWRKMSGQTFLETLMRPSNSIFCEGVSFCLFYKFNDIKFMSHFYFYWFLASMMTKHKNLLFLIWGLNHLVMAFLSPNYEIGLETKFCSMICLSCQCPVELVKREWSNFSGDCNVAKQFNFLWRGINLFIL